MLNANQWISRSGGGDWPTPPQGDEAPLRALFGDASALDSWLARWRVRCTSEDVSASSDAERAGSERASEMRSVNPIIIPRNHRVEEALAGRVRTG